MAVVLLACGFAGVWIHLGNLHRYHHGDSVLLSVVSLQRWTLFMWAQDRTGTLVPLLATPFRHPLTNLLVQYALAAAFTLAGFFFVVRCVWPRAGWVAAGALGAGLFILCQPGPNRFDFLIIQMHFGISWCFGFAALALLSPPEGRLRAWRVAVAAACLLIAQWANITILVVLLPIIALRRRLLPADAEGAARSAVGPRRRGVAGRLGGLLRGRSALAAGLVLATFVPVLVASRTYWAARTYKPLPPSRWPECWAGLAGNAWHDYLAGGWAWALAGAAAVGLACLLLPAGRRSAPRAARAAACLFAAAAANFVFAGLWRWTVLNFMMARYLYTSMVLVQGGVMLFVAVEVRAVLARRVRPVLAAASLAAFLLITGLQHGRPSVAGVRRDIDARTGRLTDELLAARATHMAGDFWVVLPAVWHADLVLYEAGAERCVYPVTYRSVAIRDLIVAVPREQMRVAVPVGDEQGRRWIDYVGLPELVECGRTEHLVIFCPRSAASAGERPHHQGDANAGADR